MCIIMLPGGTPTTPSTEIDQQPPDEEPTGEYVPAHLYSQKGLQ